METILLLALFVLIPLANYVLERMRRRYGEPPESRRVPDMGMRRQAPPPPLQAPARRERVQEAPPPIAAAPARARHFKNTLFENKRDIRRAIIAMTVLGPCRANDPPD
jgi:hypothetical protein